MGGPKPWPTRWPEPAKVPLKVDELEEPLADPDYEIEVTPQETPSRLPENRWRATSVTWGVTHRCNLHCDFCYDAVPYPRTDLDTPAARQVIDRLSEAGIKFVVFSGGEPLLHRDLFDLMVHCRARNLEIGMRSNGTLITGEIARRLAELELVVAGISLDGATEASHDAVRGPGSFRRTITAIQRLVAAGIRVNVEVVLTLRNAHQSLALVELAERLGVDEINFSAIAAEGRSKTLPDVILEPGLWQQLNSQLYEASLTAGVVVSPSCALTGPCWACVEPNLTCEGWITPCYLSKHRLFHIFDVSPEAFQARLQENRSATINTCRRTCWAGAQTCSVRPSIAQLADVI